MMAITCGKCGKAGHNARSCGKAAAPAQAKAKPKTAAAPPAGEFESVAAQLQAKREQRAKEIETIDRILAELDALGGAS